LFGAQAGFVVPIEASLSFTGEWDS
jgi:hypothetical protein